MVQIVANCPQPDYTGLVAAAIALASAMTLLIRSLIDNRALKRSVAVENAKTRNTIREEVSNISTNDNSTSPLEKVDDFPHEKF
jgi:hypothetical protein